MNREKRVKEAQKATRAIWKSMGIDKAVSKYGLLAVKKALANWVNYQRDNAKFLRGKAELEKKLAEINKKL